jgi:hypothetical protein
MRADINNANSSIRTWRITVTLLSSRHVYGEGLERMRKGKLRASGSAACLGFLSEKKFRQGIQALCTEEGCAGSASS